MREEIKAHAQIIAERLNDLDGFWFYYKYIKILGFQRCYELASLSIQEFREGRIRTSPARYFNGCVRRELKENL